jgi:hypothetical protein
VKKKPVKQMREIRHIDRLPVGMDDALPCDTARPVAAACKLASREKVGLTKQRNMASYLELLVRISSQV